jgi:hypothetical protein
VTLPTFADSCSPGGRSKWRLPVGHNLLLTGPPGRRQNDDGASTRLDPCRH